MNTLLEKEILKYLRELSNKLDKKNLKGEILLFGGAAMVLDFNARPATKDVDAIFYPKNEIYEISKEIARKYYPKNQIPQKTFYAIDEILQNILK